MKNYLKNRGTERWARVKSEERPLADVPIGKTYDWRDFMELSPGEVIGRELPHFMKGGGKSMEPWCLERIRRKFYRDLKEAKDYERDAWLPKAIHLMKYVWMREMVNLYDMAVWLGMPRRYLANLCRRDKHFRNWVIAVRRVDLKLKAEDAQLSRAVGTRSILDTLPHDFSPAGERMGAYKNPIDVGWKEKDVSRKR